MVTCPSCRVISYAKYPVHCNVYTISKHQSIITMCKHDPIFLNSTNKTKQVYLFKVAYFIMAKTIFMTQYHMMKI